MKRRDLLTYSAGLALLQACGGGNSNDNDTSLRKYQTALDKLTSDFRNFQAVPGVSAALVRGASDISSAAGVRRLDKPDAVKVDDAFHIGSNVKSMLSMIAARAVELGEIRWNSTIADAIPMLANKAGAYAAVTLEQLLDMRGGLPGFLVQSEIATLPIYTGSLSEQRLSSTQYILSLPPAAAPGNSYVYSNASYLIAATMLEQTTKKPFEVLIQERVFTPLGLSATIGWPGSSNSNAPWGHLFTNGVFSAIDPNAPETAFPEVFSPAGNVSMSVVQFAKYLRAHLQALRGEPALGVSRSSYEKLHTKVAANEAGFAFGWVEKKDKQGATLDWFYGSTDIFGCYALLQPSKNRAVAIMVNGEKPPFDGALDAIAFKILELLD
jgi:D-alanyl-D-alanine carboxypeptidase